MLSRRDYLSCSAHIALAAAVSPRFLRDAWARATLGSVVAREPFGSLERVADGVWALISTPLTGDRTTLSNGGIIAGRNGILAIEGFLQPAGATWLANQARQLTGRWPTHVILTHYHSDHANGLAGYLGPSVQRPSFQATARTRDLVLQKNLPADAERNALVTDVVVLPTGEATSIDLGDRTVRVNPRSGHTDSDVTVELDDPGVVFCGDLVWNGMFPNYVDATPSKLTQSVRSLRRLTPVVYVPGHGSLARESDLARYVALLDEVERAARKAHAAGTSAADAGAAFALPPSLGDWVMLNKAFFERAFTAWYREIG
jgi:glyoxylase-like metal-dependent hydrolase (beta-lactamase superfamily II)